MDAAIIGFVLGRTRDSWLARRIGDEVVRVDKELRKPAAREEDPMTDAEFAAQKARILGS
jgi:hypothetical protein